MFYRMISFVLIVLMVNASVIQHVWADGIRRIRENHQRRTDYYNITPIEERIANETKGINRILERNPSKKKATIKEKEDILKAVMQAAIIHGNNAFLSKTPHTDHFKILEKTGLVAYDYAYLLRDVNADEIATEFVYFEKNRDVWKSLLMKKKNGKNFGLQAISSITDDQFDNWFIDEFMKVNEGIQNDPQRYWWKKERRITTEDTGDSRRVGGGGAGGGYRSSNARPARKAAAPEREIDMRKPAGAASLNGPGLKAVAVDPNIDMDMAEGIRRSRIAQRKRVENLNPFIMGTDGTLLERYHVKGDGSCGFYVMQINREDTIELVKAYFEKDNQDPIINQQLRYDFDNANSRKIINKVSALNFYATPSILMIIAKARNVNIYLYNENRGKAEYTGINYEVTNPRRNIKILHSGRGLSEHYDLLTNIDDPIEQRAGLVLEEKALGTLLDRSFDAREAFQRSASVAAFVASKKISHEEGMALAIAKSIQMEQEVAQQRYQSNIDEIKGLTEGTKQDQTRNPLFYYYDNSITFIGRNEQISKNINSLFDLYRNALSRGLSQDNAITLLLQQFLNTRLNGLHPDDLQVWKDRLSAIFMPQHDSKHPSQEDVTTGAAKLQPHHPYSSSATETMKEVDRSQSNRASMPVADTRQQILDDLQLRPLTVNNFIRAIVQYREFSEFMGEDALKLIVDNYLFGKNPNSNERENRDSYGTLGELSLLIEHIKAQRQQILNDNKSPGLFGFSSYSARGTTYNFYEENRGLVISHSDEINSFINDAERAFAKGYISYAGLIRNEKLIRGPADSPSNHYTVLFALKTPDGKITIFAFDPSGAAYKGTDKTKSFEENEYPTYERIIRPINEVARTLHGRPWVDGASPFKLGIQHGNMACGLEATMFARYLVSLPLHVLAPESTDIYENMERVIIPGFKNQRNNAQQEHEFGEEIVGIFKQFIDRYADRFELLRDGPPEAVEAHNEGVMQRNANILKQCINEWISAPIDGGLYRPLSATAAHGVPAAVQRQEYRQEPVFAPQREVRAPTPAPVDARTIELTGQFISRVINMNDFPWEGNVKAFINAKKKIFELERGLQDGELSSPQFEAEIRKQLSETGLN